MMKPGIDANKLSVRAEENAPLHNASFAEFKARLEKAGVRVFDPGPSVDGCTVVLGESGIT